ncbi:hypothetical protein DVH05_001634 [Phytophthora capsici]|nr:hypothetical protein DVH05_001634 [Phytophthora capsici]
MEVAPTLDDAQALRQLTLADEHLMICMCGVNVESDADARVLQEAVQRIIRIKLQMGSNHQVGLARARGSQLVIEQEVQTCNHFYKGMAALNALYIAFSILKQFTRNVDALVATVPGLLCSADHGDAVVFDSLLAHTARHFSAQREMVRLSCSLTLKSADSL